nr:MAG TPA: hypothetical protein [Caudoviricetes sp.]
MYSLDQCWLFVLENGRNTLPRNYFGKLFKRNSLRKGLALVQFADNNFAFIVTQVIIIISFDRVVKSKVAVIDSIDMIRNCYIDVVFKALFVKFVGVKPIKHYTPFL